MFKSHVDYFLSSSFVSGLIARALSSITILFTLFHLPSSSSYDQGTPEKLIEHLIADLSNLDITYPEDFLLTYRTFLDSPRPIVDRLLSWHLHSPKLRARVNRIILLWVHNHFNDFEDSVEMMRFVEKFDEILAKDGTGKSSACI